MGGPTDEWQRAPLDVVVEVPLTGPDIDSDTQSDDVRSEPNWRRSIGLALIGGVLVGIVLSIMILNDDGAATDDRTESTPAADDLSTQITTPPTLQPLTPLPTPDDPALAVVEEGPQPTSSQERTLFDSGPMPPRYPDVVVMRSDETELAEYDLADAVERLGDDVARRSTTHLELGTGGFVIDVTITRDPERDRYRIVLDSRGDTQTAIVDNASGTTYLNIGTDVPSEVPNSEIIAGSDASTVNEYFDRLLLGPLRPDTLDAAEIEDRFLVTIAGVGVARQFDATIPGALVPEWQLFAFSPVFEFPVEDRPSTLDYSVYVDQRGEVAQVDGVSLVGNVPQLVQHRIEVLDQLDPIIIIDEDGDVPRTDSAETPTTSPTTTTSPVASP